MKVTSVKDLFCALFWEDERMVCDLIRIILRGHLRSEANLLETLH